MNKLKIPHENSHEMDVLKSVHNPFRGGIISDPWTQTSQESEVSEIHQDVLQTCLKAVEEVRQGISSCGIVIHGEPGSGKTHLIGRLRRHLIDTKRITTYQRLSQAFAYVRLSTNATTLARHIRRAVAINLLRTQELSPCQFERLVMARLMELDGASGDLNYWWEYIRDEHPQKIDILLEQLLLQENLSPQFIRVLKLLVTRQHRLDVTSWLYGDPLTDSAYERLGIAPDPDDAEPELIAMKTLTDFMRLAGTTVPLVICFDQVEALQMSPDDTSSYFSYGKLIRELWEADTNLVLITCMQTSRYELMKSVVPQYALDAIKSRASMALNLLDVPQATSVIKVRLNQSQVQQVRPPEAPELWPLAPNDIQQMIGKKGCVPRVLLERAATLFDELSHAPRPPEKTVTERLSEIWEERSEIALNTNDKVSTTKILSHALPLLVRVQEPQWKTLSSTKISPVQNESLLDHVFEAPEQEGRVGVKIIDGPTTQVAAQLKKLVAHYPDRLNLQKLVLLRDERNPISEGSKKTREHLRTLEKHDAVYVPIGPQALAALDAMRQLISDAQSGDLAHGAETITDNLVCAWLKENLPKSLQEIAELLTHPPTIDPPHDTEFFERLQEWLNPRRMSNWHDAIEALAIDPRDTEIKLQKIEQHDDLFGVIRGETTVIFSTRFANSEFQSTT